MMNTGARLGAFRRFTQDFSKPAVDYVVVGAGSAGCVMASRLAEKGHTVKLLEAGQSDSVLDSPLNLLLHMPTALAMPMHRDKFNWKFVVNPEEALGGRVIHCPRGKGLGGSSSINGLVYVRGNKGDFDAWEEMGATGWNYASVLPYFRKAENWHGQDPSTTKYRGTDGPLHVKFGENSHKTPLFDAFIEAGSQAGYGLTKDYNAARQEGFGPKAMTVFHSGPMKGLRCSTSSAYLHPAIKEYPNKIDVETGAMIQRVLWDDPKKDSKPRAVGVEYRDKSGLIQSLPAAKEVILCAGAIGSPQILQVSGVGDPDHLKRIGVIDSVEQIIVANPNVGKNLTDHLELYFQQEVVLPVSIAPIVKSWIRKLAVGIEWVLFRRGLGATNHFESAAFVRSSQTHSYPDIQFHFLPVAVSYDGQTIAESNSGHSMQVHIGSNRPLSRGHVLASSSSMDDPPEIQFNYMSQPEEWDDFRKAIEIARQVMRQPALSNYVGKELLPGKDSDLDEYIRDHVESAYHPCSTCKMGDDMEKHQAVVDKAGRVHGTESLRVVDASIFPAITNGNLNAPTIMVAERVADMIAGNTVLPPVEFTTEDKPWDIPDKLTDRESAPLVA